MTAWRRIMSLDNKSYLAAYDGGQSADLPFMNSVARSTPVRGGVLAPTRTCHAANVMTLEKFARRHMAQRDSLAVRKFDGETLTAAETADLEYLNAMLDSLLPPAPVMANDLLSIVEEIERRAGR